MNLRTLAKQVLVKEVVVPELHALKQREWELQEEIMCLGSHIDELKKINEDLSEENLKLDCQIENLKMLLSDLQIDIQSMPRKGLKSNET